MHQLEVLGVSSSLKLLVTDLWTLLWTILFIHLMWESSSLLFTTTCSALDVKSHLSYQHALGQLETAAMDSTQSMHQLEVLGVSSSLKLLVTDLWTLLWTILFIHLMWESSSLLFTTTCSALDVKSHLLETAAMDSTHVTHKRLCRDEVQLKTSCSEIGVPLI